MPPNFDDKLVIAISSRAPFNQDESHAVHESEGGEAYCRYQIEHEDEPLEPGIAYPQLEKLLALNQSNPSWGGE